METGPYVVGPEYAWCNDKIKSKTLIKNKYGLQ
jgi:hypothetical protein